MTKNILLRAPSRCLGAERGQCDCNCDCACVSAPSCSAANVSSSALWRRADDLYGLSLAGEYKIFCSPSSGETAVLDSFAGEILNRFALPLPICDLTDAASAEIARRLAALGFLKAEEHCVRAACYPFKSSDATLASWLHLTDRCNLRCDYCYLPHVREDMSPETGRAVMNAIFRSAVLHDFKWVKIKYAGGEPLLRYSLILELHDYAAARAEQEELNLDEVVLSNGTLLTGEMARTFKALGIRLMISLDGFGNHHDSHRPYASGRGSFKDAAEAVDLALASGLAPAISVTVSSRTAEGLPQIAAWILERDLPFSVNFYRENALSASRSDMRLDERKIVNGVLAAFKVIEENLPRRSLLGLIVDRANLSYAHAYPCAAGQNYLVFDQNGQVAKCQMQMQKPVTTLDAEDPLKLVREDRAGVQNVPVEDKEGCAACEWKYWCAGGCPLEPYRVAGRYDLQSPNCGIYKAIFPEALRLEGLRLLKYAGDSEVVTQL